MHLTRLITLHWGNLENREWEFPEMTLLTGETASGKSTLLDAIQTVLTATYAGVFFYNPGQEETTQTSRKKEKRTLADYCLGRESTNLARSSAHTYVACVFEPSSAEQVGNAFTAIVAVEAIAVGGRAEQSRLGLYIARSQTLRKSDFIADTANVVEVRELWPHLQRKFGRENVSYYADDKGHYLRSLYGAFRGQPHVSEAESLRAARAVVKAMAYKPVGSIDELVKGELLEEQDLTQDVRKVGDLLRDIRELSDEAERLQRNIDRLEKAKAEGDATLTALAEQLIHDVALARRAVIDDEEEIQRTRIKAERSRLAEQRANDTLTELARRIESQRQSANALRAKLAEIPAWNEHERLRTSIGDAERHAADRVQTLTEWLKAVGTIVEWGRSVESFDVRHLSEDVRTAQSSVTEALRSAKRLSAARLASAIAALPDHALPPQETASLVADVESLAQPASRLLDALLRGEGSFCIACEHEAGALTNDLRRLQGDEERLGATLRRLESGDPPVPPLTEKIVSAIAARLPNARPQVLAGLIEMKPGTRWQNAIEGFMGNDRFAVVVEEETEREVIDFLQAYQVRSVTIIQGRRAKRDAFRREVPGESIVEELLIEHPTASAYMRAAYGSVLKIPNTEALRDANRGLTLDGHAASGYRLFIAWASDEDLALGHDARERARRSAEAELREVRNQLDSCRKTIRELRGLSAKLRQLALTDARATARDLARIATARAEDDLARSRLDLTESRDLTAALEDAQAGIELLSNEHEQCLTTAIGLKNEADACERTARELEGGLPEKRNTAASRAARFVLLEQSAGHRVQAHELGRRAEAIAADRAVSEHAMIAAMRTATTRIAEHYGTFLGTAGQYNADARPPERLALEHESLSVENFERAVPWLALVLAEIERQLKLQRDIGIAQNRDRLKEAEGRFNHVFTSDFCFKIYSRVNAGVGALRELNRELEHLTFGNDRFTLGWDWVPEFREYYNFFHAVHDRAEDLGQKSIFDQGMLPADLIKVRDSLKDLLLDKNREVADKRLKEIADYRNYRTYEIWRESASGGRVPLSRWGTGSGGELETPFYIVRSAVLSSALRFFTKEGAHLRLMLSDEAFAKMDESRRRSVIRYLRKALGLQFIVAMPTSNSGSIKPEFDKEFTFAKVPATRDDGSAWMVSEVQEKNLKPSTLEALWQAAREVAAEQAREEFFRRNPGARAEIEKA